MTTTPATQLPYAVRDGSLTHISQAHPDGHYLCPGCEDQVEPCQTDQEAWHFRHMGGYQCEYQQVLHQTARLLVEKLVADAQDNRRPLAVTLQCRSCHREAFRQDLAEPGTSISLEDERVLNPLRPDITVRQGNQTTIIEILAGQDLEPETRGIYEHYAIPALTVRVQDLDSLQYLRRGLRAEAGINIPATCPECQAQRERRNVEQHPNLPDRAEAWRLMGEMVDHDPTKPMDPIWIPFDFLPDDIQAELNALPQERQDPVALKLCAKCGLPAVLFHDLVVWTGAAAGLGVAATVTHRECWDGKPTGPLNF